jgi:hypothetical protein
MWEEYQEYKKAFPEGLRFAIITVETFSFIFPFEHLLSVMSVSACQLLLQHNRKNGKKQAKQNIQEKRTQKKKRYMII